ncbi:MAG: FAD-dependent oxidoreductase [Candidatus Eisenbacteria sp.]|nr:FAD-dependent oxidoreductase [Candidatus Eisenbacteria bacterium]
MKRLVVIGGGAAGPSVAAKAKRVDRNLDVQMFDQGPHVSYAACPTPYFIAGRIPTAERLIARSPEKFAQSGIDVHLRTGIETLDLAAGMATDTGGRRWPYDYVAYTTGASSRRLEAPGGDAEGVFSLKDLSDAIEIERFVRERRPRRAVILGAGLIAMEMAEAFRELELETTILYRGTLPARRLGPELATLVLEELERCGVTFVPEAEVAAIESSSRGLRIESNRGAFDADLVLVALGIRPNTALAGQAGIRLGATGAVATDRRQRTNHEQVFSAGDCAEATHRITGKAGYFPYGDVANKQGRVAGANIGGEEAEFPGVLASWCFKVFDLEVASTGLTPAEAQAEGIDAVAVQVRAGSRAGAYPGARPLHLRLVAERGSGRLLGAQAVGADQVVGRIDVVAAGLQRGMTAADLAQLDLCYAPPFSPVWDPLHIAAGECLKKL